MLLYLGNSVLLLSREHATSGRVLYNAANEFPVTYTTGGPAHLVSIIDHAEAHANGKQLLGLRMIMASGAMTSKATQERIRAFYANASFYEVYGSTEAGIISILDPTDFKGNEGSVGIEPSGVSMVRFVDPVSGEPVAGTLQAPGPAAEADSDATAEAVSGGEIERSIRAHSEAHLAPHLVPDVVLPLSETSWAKLPKTATRKIMRSRLRLHSL
ncbi:Acyl-CoA ligase azaF [Hondaea fermentalgiana]|uniref:Acyl-CoA ligase azaF n=1 Tax=Hondaea fermentalgiana TaxID=2315210 RepID=A0A2R5GLJ6_9STRA|nr:Acyl-CoA ligase azaF [Hondaea fermentalgiana]|eukprot:GBG29151.1 Acyl-CoA ligase azaF [Hondaea fermentalgiana]